MTSVTPLYDRLTVMTNPALKRALKTNLCFHIKQPTGQLKLTALRVHSVPTTSYIDIVIEKYEAANEREFLCAMHLDVDRSPVTSLRQVTTTSCAFPFPFSGHRCGRLKAKSLAGHAWFLLNHNHQAMEQTEAFMIRQASCSMRITRITGHRESRSLFIASPWNGFCHGRAENGLIPVD